MDETYPAAEPVESRIVEGWSALELGDLETARAALRDVYDVNPTHPALPMLAAGIRRVRPKRKSRRGTILLLLAVAAIAVFAVRAGPRSEPAPAPPTEAAEAARAPEPAPPVATGTMGQADVPSPPPPVPRTVPAPVDEDVLVRQAIARFETSYRSRWGGLTFRHCDIARDGESATATCRASGDAGATDIEADRLWTFSLKQTDGAWRIVSVEPSAM